MTPHEHNGSGTPERDGLRHAAEPAKLAAREVARKQDVQQTGSRGSQEKPGRELKPYLPDRVEHAGDMGLGPVWRNPPRGKHRPGCCPDSPPLAWR